MSYILITPVKNEEKSFPNLAISITRQTCLPSIWVIVDDNCTDQTPEIIKNLMDRYDWIYSIKKKEINEYSHLSFATSVEIGYEYAKDICERNNINCDYIGKIDADILLPENYFQKIIDEFKKDLRLAILSGSIIQINDINDIKEKKHAKSIKEKRYILGEFADERLYRKEFLDEVGGFPITYSPDTVLLIKAKVRGWKIKEIQNLNFYEVRKSYQKETWRRMRNRGYGRYFLNYHPFLVLLAALHMMTKKPYYHAIAYCYGYLFGALKRDRKIEDAEIRYYFWYIRWNEIKDKIIDKIKDGKSLFKILRE